MNTEAGPSSQSKPFNSLLFEVFPPQGARVPITLDALIGLSSATLSSSAFRNSYSAILNSKNCTQCSLVLVILKFQEVLRRILRTK